MPKAPSGLVSEAARTVSPASEALVSRVAWLGSPSASATCLEALHAAGHEIALVVTEPDRRRGRGGALQATPVKALALELGLPVSHDLSDLTGLGAELGVVVAFGRIIPARLLDVLPMVNLHFSLLPRWRGAAPVERAILGGDASTGVCLMQLEAGLDTGGVYRRVETPIGPEETAAELTARLAVLGSRLLVDGLSEGVAGLGEPVPQSGAASYAAKLTSEDRHLDFSRTAVELHRQVRVGRAWTTFRGQRVIVQSARVATSARPHDAVLTGPGSVTAGGIVTGAGLLVPVELQAEGRRPQRFDDWLRGARVEPGERFGEVVSGAGGDHLSEGTGLPGTVA